MTYRASVSSSTVLIRYRCNRRLRMIEAEFMSSNDNFVPRRVHLLVVITVLARQVVEGHP